MSRFTEAVSTIFNEESPQEVAERVKPLIAESLLYTNECIDNQLDNLDPEQITRDINNNNNRFFNVSETWDLLDSAAEYGKAEKVLQIIDAIETPCKELKLVRNGYQTLRGLVQSGNVDEVVTIVNKALRQAAEEQHPSEEIITTEEPLLNEKLSVALLKSDIPFETAQAIFWDGVQTNEVVNTFWGAFHQQLKDNPELAKTMLDYVAQNSRGFRGVSKILVQYANEIDRDYANELFVKNIEPWNLMENREFLDTCMAIACSSLETPRTDILDNLVEKFARATLRDSDECSPESIRYIGEFLSFPAELYPRGFAYIVTQERFVATISKIADIYQKNQDDSIFGAFMPTYEVAVPATLALLATKARNKTTLANLERFAKEVLHTEIPETEPVQQEQNKKDIKNYFLDGLIEQNLKFQINGIARDLSNLTYTKTGKYDEALLANLEQLQNGLEEYFKSLQPWEIKFYDLILRRYGLWGTEVVNSLVYPDEIAALEIKKTGSKLTIVLEGDHKGEIRRDVNSSTIPVWEAATNVLEPKAGGDYLVGVEPLLEVKNNGETSEALTVFCGYTGLEAVNMIRNNGDEEAGLRLAGLYEDFITQIDKTLKMQGINHGHLHHGNVTVEFVRNTLLEEDAALTRLNTSVQDRQHITTDPLVWAANPTQYTPIFRVIDFDRATLS